MLYSPDFLAGIRLALRAHYLWLAGCSLLVLALAVLLAAQFSGRQPATVALDIGLSVMRLLLPLVLVLMTQELLSREFDQRYFLNSLTYPRPRHKLLLGRFLAVAALTLGLLLAMALLLALLVGLVGQGYAQGTPVALDMHYLVSIAFVGLDLLLLTALACLLAVVASTPSFVLIGTFGFMLVARSFAAIVELLSRDTWVVGDAESYRAGVGLLGYLLPDLGALDVRMVALYGSMDFLPADWSWLLLSSLAYVVALLALAVWALQRKRFA
ncbi:MAG: ABC transporter permease [Pseudomonas sp.]|uniref:ABC transporter permease n=1 Tax=Pseudomonas sp. TaxID=306 RepID=UPI00299E3197|nr:ABC transporter permease [Pseudomonas sp.]MDX1724040.1 ABC transporter permease [Pseudomonas sp.]